MSLPLLILISFVLLIPICWAMYISFFEYGLSTITPLYKGFSNFARVLNDKGLKISFNLTASWSLLKVGIEFMISFFIALFLYKKTKLNSFILLILCLSWFLPAYITVSGWRAFLSGYGSFSFFKQLTGLTVDFSINKPLSFISSVFVNVWLSVPFTTLITLGLFKTIPKNISDLLKVDGAGDFTRMKIFFGQIRYTLIPFFFIQVIGAFTSFSTIYLLTGSGPLVKGGFTSSSIIGTTSFLGVLLYDKFSIMNDYGLLSSYSLIVGLICLVWIFFALLSRIKNKYKRIVSISVLSFILLTFQLFLRHDGPVMLLYFSYLACFIILLIKRNIFRKVILFPIFLDISLNIFMFFNDGARSLLPLSFIIIPSLILSLRYDLPITNISIPKWIKWTLMMIWLSFTVVILIFILLLSLNAENSLLIDFQNLTLKNYYRVLFDENILKYILNTVLLSAFTIIITVLTAIPFSYSMSRKKSFLNRSAYGLVFFNSVFFGMHILLPTYLLFSRMNLTNSLFGMSLIITVQVYPITLILLSNFFSKIPQDLYDYSRIEGLSYNGFLFRILLPLSYPVIMGILVFVIVRSWNAFSMPLLFVNSDSIMPYSLKIYSYAGQISSSYTAKWNLFGASSIIGIIPLIFLYRKSLNMIYNHEI